MVSARPQFEAACQLQEFAGLAQWECRELVPLRRVFDSLDQLQVSMAGLAEWLRHWIVAPVTRVRFSHLAPNWAVRIKGLSTACTREMRVRVSHRPPDFWLVNSTVECWSEKPVDTVQFRDEPPTSGCRVAATHMSWAHVHAGSTPATRTIFLPWQFVAR